MTLELGVLGSCLPPQGLASDVLCLREVLHSDHLCSGEWFHSRGPRKPISPPATEPELQPAHHTERGNLAQHGHRGPGSNQRVCPTERCGHVASRFPDLLQPELLLTRPSRASSPRRSLYAAVFKDTEGEAGVASL